MTRRHVVVGLKPDLRIGERPGLSGYNPIYGAENAGVVRFKPNLQARQPRPYRGALPRVIRPKPALSLWVSTAVSPSPANNAATASP